ncbi:amidohydrolase, partial [Pseudomonas sp. MPR-R1B]
IDALVAAGAKGIDLLPTGHASIAIGQPTQVEGPHGLKTIKLAFLTGYGFAPSPVWLDSDNRLFGNAGVISMLPEGYEKNGPKLKD